MKEKKRQYFMLLLFDVVVFWNAIISLLTAIGRLYRKCDISVGSYENVPRLASSDRPKF